MAEPIYEAIVTNQGEFPLILAGYVLHPQVPTRVRFYKNSDLKTYLKYATLNVVQEKSVVLNDSGAIGGGGSVTGTTYSFPFEEADFVSVPGGKWRITVTHNLGRIPDINVYDENESLLYGDIDHAPGSTPNSFTLTFSKKIKCTVYIN
jgi:hypothetical protein